MHRHLAAALGFLTIIPVGSSYPLDLVAEGMYLFPAVGFVLGGVGGLVEFSLMRLLPHLLSASLGLALILVLGGFNHLDGLADFGDGLMCVGDRARKIEAMRDTAVGAGGLGAMLLVVVSSVSALSAYTPAGSLYALIVAESLAKHSMVTLAFLGRSASEGMNTSFFRAMRGRGGVYRYAAATATALAVGYVFRGVSGLLAFLASYAASILIMLVADAEFGGLTGDVFGAANEIVRLVALIALLPAL